MKTTPRPRSSGHVRRITIIALAFGVCFSLLGAKCGSGKTNPTPSPSRTTAAAIPPQVPATTAPATPISTPTSTPTGAPAADLSGAWSGTWTDTSPDTKSGSFHLTWKQSGSTLSGTITVSGTECISGGTLTGSLKGSAITFGAVHGRIEITYTGTVAGSSMHGTYDTNARCSNAHGNWTASRN